MDSEFSLSLPGERDFKKKVMDINNKLEKVLQASRKLNLISDEKIRKILFDLADETINQTDLILSENQKDLDRMNPEDPKFDRLKLNSERINGIAADIRNVANLNSPVGKILSEKVHVNGMSIKKITVPFGVIGIIYEARPNVTFDVFALCLKSGNACVLKGGSDATYSNEVIVSLIHKILEKHGVDKNTVCLLGAGRDEAQAMFHAHGYIDLIIPRGSQGLIDFVRKNSTIPVIETGAGICHTYFERSGDVKKGKEIIYNAKTRRPSVCNALDCLVIEESRLDDLPELTARLAEENVIIYADEKAFGEIKGIYPEKLLFPATEESFGTEFLSLKMAVKTVKGFKEALEHISKYSSKHSEAIISEDKEKSEMFKKLVDAASVYTNVSTAFTDGAQFGLCAEIGISTQKLHARGPMALEELTSYKWIVEGDGQIRPK